jgi:replicative DNA helicase
MIPDRHPPFAPEAEISVLGGMLIDNDAVPKAVELVDESMFYRQAHRVLFRTMLKLFNRGAVVDPPSLIEALRDAGELESAGGMDLIADLLDVVPTAASIAHHCKIVRDRAIRRRTIEACLEAIHVAYQPGDIATEELLDDVQGRLYTIGTQATEDSLVWVRKSLGKTFEKIEAAQASGGGITGVPSGLRDLDEMLGGFQKGDLILIAARPSMGKTAMVTGCALHAAVTRQTATAIFSLEMTTHQLNNRMLCYESLVDLGKLLRGGLSDDDYTRLAQVAGYLNGSQIAIDDRSSMTPAYIRSRARRLKSECPELGLIVVDYVQLVTGEGDNEEARTTHTSHTLKAIAKELDVPVIALSQLSRANESRADKRPQLSDLRYSGSLEQDADVVIMLHRPEYYMSPTEVAKDGCAGKAEAIVRKQRNGPTGTVDLFFRKESARFESYSESASWTIPR